ncbi:hypothetical protein [Rahnella woolbedingensis]|uniref:Uncharacterized protein n=1 Tax=Rahnella woolbedingensis TaxID=1510574 RepID=A0A419NAW1_9GAMM|nr:hypothetical protein [Rahnella woolbedingensis]RJT45089.1 hypothetical protein D6C13_08345 [Rahnella woolbedingensis]
MRNSFCSTNLSSDFPKWSAWDAGLWISFRHHSIFSWVGDSRLFAYKFAYLEYNKDRISETARQEGIPVLLLVGVIFNELGGMPERAKLFIVLPLYKIDDLIKGEGNNRSNKTSLGSTAMQLRVAAETMGIDAEALTTTQQLQLANCLLDDSFNINIVARHLRVLIKADNPNLKDYRILSEEQIIIAGSRYNRGMERKREDYVASIAAQEGDPIREYSSSGRTIMRRKEAFNNLFGINE